MGGPAWSDHETAIVVYFASRHVSHEGCRKILALKCAGKRTTVAIRNKLDGVRQIDGLWHERTGWDRNKVDKWLVGLGIHSLCTLVGAGFEELQMVAPVSIVVP